MLTLLTHEEGKSIEIRKKTNSVLTKSKEKFEQSLFEQVECYLRTKKVRVFCLIWMFIILSFQL